jgi:hypothetical protein
MNDYCEGNTSIPASSFARAAAALALESRSPNEAPDSDSSISDCSPDCPDTAADSHDSGGSSHYSDRHELDGEPSEAMNHAEVECGADTNSDFSRQQFDNNDASGADLDQSELDASDKSPNANFYTTGMALNGKDVLETPTESQSTPQPIPCELTPETSNKTNNIGLFESDSTIENRRTNQEQSESPKLNEQMNGKRVPDYPEDNVYDLCPTYAHSPASFADSSCSFMPSPAPSAKKVVHSKPRSTEQSSLLSRGLSLFGRKAVSSRYSSNAQTYNENDASSVISDLSHDVRSVKSATTLRTTASANQRLRDDNRLQKHLEESGLVLVKRLVEFLSACPLAPDEEAQQTAEDKSNGASQIDNAMRKKPRGLTLPACAIGWLSCQIMKLRDDATMSCDNRDQDIFDCYQVPKQQLECLQNLLRRVTSLRLTNDKWPPPLAPMISEAADIAKRKAFSSIPETGIVTSRILSKFTDQSSLTGINSLGDDSVSTGTAKETAATPFQRYFHELQYNPNVDMRLFPYASKVVVEGIPPSWISNLDTLKNLEMFQMEKGCILDINQLFFPSDGSEAATSTADDTSTLFMYESLTKLRLSNCAINEAAGLRGRRGSKSSHQCNARPKRIPTMSRFPNMESLNLSHNELFRTKTALAGLSLLPLLSSINLSYNRLSG